MEPIQFFSEIRRAQKVDELMHHKPSGSKLKYNIKRRRSFRFTTALTGAMHGASADMHFISGSIHTSVACTSSARPASPSIASPSIAAPSIETNQIT